MKQTERLPRGILPTYVTDKLVVLSKAAPTLRNTYEIRLALYMAKSKGLRFVLAVRPGAEIEPSVLSLLEAHGGKVEEVALADYSVYFGHAHPNGEEDGWVFGDNAAMDMLSECIENQWLREHLRVGANFAGADLDRLEQSLLSETMSAANVDGENVRDALLSLVQSAKQEGGIVFVQ
jgi:hypothetical protein